MKSEPDVVGPWLETHRGEVLDAWRGLILARFAALAGGGLSNPDPFANPLGSRVYESTAALLDALAGGRPREALAAAMEPLMRVLAIQDGSASDAVAFVPLLQRASAQLPGGTDPQRAESLRERLDGLLLIAFDVYMRCREEIFEIRVREARRRVSALLDRLSVVDEAAGS